MRRLRGRPTIRSAFTLVELLIAICILGLLVALALPPLHDAVELARVARATAEIRGLQVELAREERLPATLGAIGRAGLVDPWGNAYVYLPFERRGGIGAARKDRFLVPLNTDYDLYSMGADGATAPPLAARQSQDDVIRANNGSFVGLASRY
ncbi:MAG TPA: prepilin-type N-terminal cleavage/methylation domain-containing protein [Gemmatimonadaceae bacterium]|nr:prepilin-type N-terminal cleavage/methylation domain-containing protein [Gemmatimonadaceae bacterium]